MKIASSPPGEVGCWLLSSAPHCKGTHPSTGEMAEQGAPVQSVTSSRMGVTLVMEDYCSLTLSLFPNNKFNIQGNMEDWVMALYIATTEN